MSKEIVIGIDASRNRSGGAIIHIKGILENIDPKKYGIKTVHLWAYRELCDKIEDAPWLIKHTPDELDGNIFKQLYWQRVKLKKSLTRFKCDVLLSTDAGTICRFDKNVVMSRDMLSYEPGITSLYSFFSKSRLRLFLLRHIQNASLRSAYYSVFLTKYASSVIQNSTGKLEKTRVIPHGVSDYFYHDYLKEVNLNKKNLDFVYVSNAAPYKNQDKLISAFDGFDFSRKKVRLTFIGGGDIKNMNHLIARAKGIKNSNLEVCFIDKLGHSELKEHMKDKDVFVFASSCENMPNTLVEGMCTGMPIICSNKGPMPEVLKDGGIYFDPYSTVSIQSSIDVIINNYDLAKRVGLRSHELSKQYSWARCAHETFDLLVEVAKK